MARESTLGYLLLGLLQHQPQSGYDLRKIVVSTPMALFSDSPGAIYPALRRLQRQGLIVAERAPRSGRRRAAYSPAAKGRAALAAWLTREPTRDEVTREWDVMMLRLAFMSGLVPASGIAAFLDRLHAETASHRAELETFLRSHRQEMPPSAVLAFECGLDGCRSRERWLRRARVTARSRLRRPR